MQIFCRTKCRKKGPIKWADNTSPNGHLLQKHALREAAEVCSDEHLLRKVSVSEKTNQARPESWSLFLQEVFFGVCGVRFPIRSATVSNSC